MGKRVRKIEAIKKYIGNVSGNWPSYSYGQIPNDKARNACNSYAGAIQVSDILGLVDISITNNGKKGLVFTEHRVYYDNGLFESRGSVTYKSVSENGSIPGALFGSAYNKQALNELVSLLSKIDAETLSGTVNDAVKTANDVLDTIESIGAFLKRLGESNDSEKKNSTPKT